MSKPTLWSIIFMLSTAAAFAQVKVGDNPNTILPTSALEIESTNKGVLIPRITKAQKNAIAAPSTGLLVFQSAPDSVGFHYYNGGWIWLEPLTGNNWKLTGNAGTNPATNFIGTTDAQPLYFRTNNTNSGKIENNAAVANTFLGFNSGTSISSGTLNTALGYRSLAQVASGARNVTIGVSAMGNTINGSSNIAIGNNTLQSFGGSGSVAIGDSALNNVTSGGLNTAIGYKALKETNGSSNNAIGYAAMINSTSGNFNVAIGHQTMFSNTGSNNIAMGYLSLASNNGNNNIGLGGYSLGLNNTGSYNVAIGDSAARSSNGSNLVAVGSKSLFSNTTGYSNTALGARALYDNTTGNNNVAIGDSAAYNSNVSEIVAIGSKALFTNTTGTQNTAVGAYGLFRNTTGSSNTSVGYGSLSYNTTGFTNTAIGGAVLNSNTSGFANTGLGYSALALNTTGTGNLAIGTATLNTNISGDNNTAIGYRTLFNNTTGNYNIGIGDRSLEFRNGTSNIAIGTLAGAKSAAPVTALSNNIFIGANSGYNSTGSNNVFIGNDVGTSLALSNILAIDNSNTLTPLIFGSFATDLLRINGTLNINNEYSFPTADGTVNQVLYSNGAGTVGWANAVAAANNGLNVVGSISKLGGTLIDSTTITQGANSMVFDLNGTGDFYVRKNTADDAFMVKNNGFVGLNTSDPQYRLHIVNVSGGNGPFGRGLVIENSNTGSIGEASIAFKNNGPGSVPANRAWISGLNNATNYVFAYGDSLKPSNVKMKLDTAGNVSIGTNGVAAQSRFDVFGSIGNSIKLISANYTANDDDHTIIVSAGTGAITIVLPVASTCERREYIIVNRTASDKTISPVYNDFSGTSTAALANNSITLQSNGTNWYRIR
jgi:trimeric autotransporter adhesin